MNNEVKSYIDLLKVLPPPSVGMDSSVFSAYAKIMKDTMEVVDGVKKRPENCSSFKDYMSKNKED